MRWRARPQKEYGEDTGEDFGENNLENVEARTSQDFGENVAEDDPHNISEDDHEFVTDCPENYPGAVTDEEASDKSDHDSDHVP